jgi:Fe-S cluster assembly iron-binding protein IscA
MSDREIKLEVTKAAQDQVSTLIKAQKPGTAVRVFLQSGGGGCGSGGCGCGSEGGGGGPAFAMAFDQVRNGDQVVRLGAFQIVVDDMSAAMLDGAQIDFVQDLNATGFKITAPNLPAGGHEAHGDEAGGGGCGCGSGGCGCG